MWYEINGVLCFIGVKEESINISKNGKFVKYKIESCHEGCLIGKINNFLKI